VTGKLTKHQVGLKMELKAMGYELNSSGSEHGNQATVSFSKEYSLPYSLFVI
jgi:hypothetical protein